MAWKRAHTDDHRGERDYAKDIWNKGECYPERMTALNMDAPTERQFEVPVQRRKAHDGVKSLATAPKWASKMTGVLVAGAGMMSFVARHGLGSGPNLSLTVLYLTLVSLVQRQRPIGTCTRARAHTRARTRTCAAHTRPFFGSQVHTSMCCSTTPAVTTRTMK